MNNPKAEKAMQSISIYSKKTGRAVKKTSKWISKVSQTIFYVSKNFCGLKSQELKMKKECMKLGELAYNRWKRKKAMSLQEHLNMIKELDLNILSKRQKLLHSKRKLNTLFHFKTHYSSVQTKKNPPVMKTEKTVKENIEEKKETPPEKKSAVRKPKKTVTKKKTAKKPASAKTRTKSTPKPADINKETT